MNEFETETGKWTGDRLQAFLDERKALMTEGPASIIDVGSVSHNRAFSGTAYDDISDPALSYERWKRVRLRKPMELVDPNPFVRSPDRDGGYRCWDAVVRIPDPAWRNSKPEHLYRLRSIRGCNRQWVQEIWPKLMRWTLMGPEELGRLLESWIFDLRLIPHGWEVFEAAHVLAHMRGDRLLASTKEGPADLFPLAALFRRCVAEVIVALAYDLPLDVGNRCVSQYGDTNLPYGISVGSSIWLSDPKLTVAYEGPAMMQLDRTLGLVDVGMMIRAHPAAYDIGSTQHTETDRFAWMPRLVCIAGWETPATLFHWLLAQPCPDGPIFPAMSAADLMTPDSFWAYLALGTLHRGSPPGGPTWKRLFEWMNSGEYLEAYARTPPLPCKHCLTVNRRVENAPQRPQHRPPRSGKLARDRDWHLYVQDVRKITRIIENATVEYEGTVYGGMTAARKIRAERRRRNRAHMAELKDDVWFEQMQRKSREGHTRTVRQEQRYQRILSQRQQGSAATQDDREEDWDAENQAWV